MNKVLEEFPPGVIIPFTIKGGRLFILAGSVFYGFRQMA